MCFLFLGSRELIEDEPNEAAELHFRTYHPTDKSDKYCTDVLEMSYDPLRSDGEVDEEYESNLRQNISDDCLKTISERTETETKSELSDIFKSSSHANENLANVSKPEARNPLKIEIKQIPCASLGVLNSPSPKPGEKLLCDNSECQNEIEHKYIQCSTSTPVFEKSISCKISPDCHKTVNTEFEPPKNTSVVGTVSKLGNDLDNRLKIQHMPSIYIQRDLVMQKVLNLDIKPVIKPDDYQPPLTNVSYLECSHTANVEKKVACNYNRIRESLTKNLSHIEEVRKHAGKPRNNVLARIDTIADSIRCDLNILNKSRQEKPTKDHVIIYKCIDDLSDGKLSVKCVDESRKINIPSIYNNSVILDDEVVKDEPEREVKAMLKSKTSFISFNEPCICEIKDPSKGIEPKASYIYIHDVKEMVCRCDSLDQSTIEPYATSSPIQNKDASITFVTDIISEKSCEKTKPVPGRMKDVDPIEEEELILVHDVSVQVSLEDFEYSNEDFIKTYTRTSVSSKHRNIFDDYPRNYSMASIDPYVQEMYDPMIRKSVVTSLNSSRKSFQIASRVSDFKNSYFAGLDALRGRRSIQSDRYRVTSKLSGFNDVIKKDSLEDDGFKDGILKVKNEEGVENKDAAKNKEGVKNKKHVKHKSGILKVKNKEDMKNKEDEKNKEDVKNMEAAKDMEDVKNKEDAKDMEDVKYLENEKNKIILKESEISLYTSPRGIIEIEPNIIQTVQVERILAPKSIKSSKSNLDLISDEFPPKDIENPDLNSYLKPCRDKISSTKKRSSRRRRQHQTIIDVPPTGNGRREMSFSEGEAKNNNDLSNGEVDTNIQTIMAPTVRNLSPKNSLRNGKQDMYNKNMVSYYYSKNPQTCNRDTARFSYTLNK